MSDPIYIDAKRPTTFREGIEFQDFVCDQLARRHVILQNLSSKKYQIEVGENLQGFEIKMDSRCSETGRLSIEVAEKSKASISSFTASGIYRNDNAWLYIQGNYDALFVFGTNILMLLHKSGKYKEKEEATIRAFYLPFNDARKYSNLFLDFRQIPLL
jgi:hypothetical protein